MFVAQKHGDRFMLVHVKGKLHTVLICGGVRGGRAVGSAGVAGNGGEVLVLAQRGRRAHAACSHSSITVTGGCSGWAPGDARPDILHVPHVFNFSCCVSCFSSPWREEKVSRYAENRARSVGDGIQTVIMSSLKQHGQKKPTTLTHNKAAASVRI